VVSRSLPPRALGRTDGVDEVTTGPLETAAARLDAVGAEVAQCRRCPRLVEWREEVARTKRAAYAEDDYWGRGVPAFGDPGARVLVVGLAPAAHGANRTGRMFTGDRSGEWLYRALWRAGFASQPDSVGRDDGMELHGAWITAPVKCAPPANKPTPVERDACAPYLSAELALLDQARVVVALGKFGFDAVCDHLGLRPRPRFGHGVEVEVPGLPSDPGHGPGPGLWLLGCYHVSQQNTFTGKLTEPMLDGVFARARALADLPAMPERNDDPATVSDGRSPSRGRRESTRTGPEA
jgi:uracil-DNA glycosylase family 4